MRQQRGEGNACLSGQVTSVGSRSPVLLETLGDVQNTHVGIAHPRSERAGAFVHPLTQLPFKVCFEGVIFTPPAEGLVVWGAAEGG